MTSPLSGSERWLAVTVKPGSDRAAVIEALFAVGSQGVHETDTDVRTQFPPGADADAITCAVLAASPDAQVTTEEVEPVDWTEAWKHGIGAHDLGALSISPPWLAEDHDPARTIVIDPGMAFGTGEHPTTRGVVRLMAAVIRAGDRVADLGAAIEIDPDAISNAEENVTRNGVADRVRVLEGDADVLLPLVAPVRVVLANIISSVLVRLLPGIARSLAPDGVAILSGILLEERDDMLRVLADGNWHVLAEDAEGIWWSAAIERR
jgi:ribosomal protein L11 methyltransferase